MCENGTTYDIVANQKAEILRGFPSENLKIFAVSLIINHYN